MKLKTELSMFQGLVIVVWFCVHLNVCGMVWDFIDGQNLAENNNWAPIILYFAIMGVVALAIAFSLQFVFGISWFCSESSKICASSLKWLDMYQPSSIKFSSLPFSGEYDVQLKLVLNARDLRFLDKDCPRSGMNYFCFFEGHFPFAKEQKTKLYLTRAALRQIHRAIRNINKDADDMANYVQFKFEFEVPYLGREIPTLGKRCYLLSRWDIQEIGRNTDDMKWVIKDLALSPEKLAEYRSYLENAELDTFIEVASEPEV